MIVLKPDDAVVSKRVDDAVCELLVDLAVSLPVAILEGNAVFEAVTQRPENPVTKPVVVVGDI